MGGRKDGKGDEAQSRKDRAAAIRGSAALLRALIRVHGRPQAEVLAAELREARHAR